MAQSSLLNCESLARTARRPVDTNTVWQTTTTILSFTSARLTEERRSRVNPLVVSCLVTESSTLPTMYDPLPQSSECLSHASFSQISVLQQNYTCQKLCSVSIPPEDSKFINDRILEDYALNWIIDGLPAAEMKEARVPSLQLTDLCRLCARMYKQANSSSTWVLTSARMTASLRNALL
jgi:hypothetical protein